VKKQNPIEKGIQKHLFFEAAATGLAGSEGAGAEATAAGAED
jgi:hypothetical protein